MKRLYLGVDVGSVSTDFVLMNEDKSIYKKLYLRTKGNPVSAVACGINEIFSGEKDIKICGVGATGSGRNIAASIIGADLVKNEITAHGIAAICACPEVRTVLEIGGQDSKIIFIENHIVVDFNMNTVCAAGTGSFLDRQAERLGIGVEKIGDMVLKSENPCPIAGRCAVFAESDMIHKQQDGIRSEDILAGLCEALVRNYLNNLCAGKKIEKPVMFQGGVAANKGIVKAFEKELGTEIIIPQHYDVMGAWGAAILAGKKYEKTFCESKFKGSLDLNGEWTSRNQICTGCANRCSVAVVCLNGHVIGKIGNKCDKTKV